MQGVRVTGVDREQHPARVLGIQQAESCELELPFELLEERHRQDDSLVDELAARIDRCGIPTSRRLLMTAPGDEQRSQERIHLGGVIAGVDEELGDVVDLA